MDEGTIIEWLVSPGAAVAVGDVLALVESEKAQMELPSPAGGILTKLLVAEDETVAVGEPLAVIAADQAEYESLRDRMGAQ